MTARPASLITMVRGADGRRYALKRLRPEDAGREDLHLRLANEAAVLAMLAGTPGVIGLVEVLPEPLTLVLEWADGGSLDARLRHHAIDHHAAEAIARSLLRVVTALHRRGVVHRDIKPSNILFVGDELRLADFGVAAHGDPLRALPAGWEEDQIGTPPWGAPELAVRADLHTSLAADVYSVAKVIETLLQGELPPAFRRAVDRDPGKRPSIAALAAAPFD